MFIKNYNFKPAYWILGWLLLNLAQAYFSPIDADEAYYWMYADQLDWGYFDHPPAVAALIAMGKDWLPGALGLRFGHILFGIGTAWLIWDLLDRPKGALAWLAALVISIQPMLQVYGFIATPDGPLLFFTALLLRQYKGFLAKPTIINGLIMGVVMSALLYSKYHGLILILFMAIPNLGWLIRQPGAWVAAGFGALLYLPHLNWQYVHDFPSFRYHLSGRNDPYQFKYTTEFLLNQLVIFNPFLIYYYLRSLARKTTGTRQAISQKRFYRSCRWLIFLTFGFFLYSTSKGGTEAQWTAMLCVPLVYVLVKNIALNPSWHKTIWRLGVASLLIFGLARVLLMLPQRMLPFDKPFNAKPWVVKLEKIAGDLPVVFENSYRDPSHYKFYSGKAATTFTDAYYRPNQFDIWRGDTVYQGQQVLFVSKSNWKDERSVPFTAQTKKLRTVIIDDFQVAKYVKLSNKADFPDKIQAGQLLDLEIYAHNQENFQLNLRSELNIELFIIFQEIGAEWSYVKLQNLKQTTIDPGKPQLLFKGQARVPDDLVKTEQLFQLGLGYAKMAPLRGQSAIIPVLIE